MRADVISEQVYAARIPRGRHDVSALLRQAIGGVVHADIADNLCAARLCHGKPPLSLRFGGNDRHEVADIKLNQRVSLRHTVAELSSSYWSLNWM
jgi:hypothetical protein